MRTVLPEIAEPVVELKQRLRKERDADRKRRLHLLVLVADKQVSTREQAAQHLAVHRNTVCRWLRDYQRGGLEQLLSVGPRGAPVGSKRLTPAIKEALKQRLDTAQGFNGYGDVQQWLRDEYGQEIPYTTVHRWVRYELKAKLKRSRPEHPKKTLPQRRHSPNSLSDIYD